jgi:membrane protease YdiL (CAAX protease family)
MNTDGKTSVRVVLLAVLAGGILPFFHLLPRAVALIVTFAAGLTLVAALVIRKLAAVHAALLVLLLAVWSILAPLRVWPSIIIPLLIYAIVVLSVPSLRRTTTWLKAGSINRVTATLMILTVAASSAGLPVWFMLWKPDLGPFLRSIPSWSPALLVLEGAGFALLNAAMEESIFRGVLMQALDDVLGEGAWPVVLQAVAFGLFHIKGIPSGWTGVVMATFYGLLLGLIRRRSRGILAPYVTHVFADIVIFALLAAWVR